jgi:hypothetical protein
MNQLALVMSGNGMVFTCGNKNAKAIALALLPCLCCDSMLVHLEQRSNRLFGDGSGKRADADAQMRTSQSCVREVFLIRLKGSYRIMD